ncbi:hypothetical protein EsH8_II_001116 [Colletotrichum jinshuiense]
MPLLRSSSGLDAILNRPEETALRRLLSSPLSTTARFLNDFFPVASPVVAGSRPPGSEGEGDDHDDAVTIVCISDTHNAQPRLPAGDILVHAGDLTASGTREELQRALDWIGGQPHRHKVVVAGNHDLCLDENLLASGAKKSRTGTGQDPVNGEKGSGGDDDDDEPLDWGDIIYLDRTSTTLKLLPRGASAPREIRIYGSPCTPQHGAWAFQYPRSRAPGPWAGAVPPETDVLVTHAPPKGHMDDPRGNWGCELLLAEVWRARPRLHVFGHVHCGHGREALAFDALQRGYEDAVREEAAARAAGSGAEGWRAWGRGVMALGRCFWAWVLVWRGGGGRARGETVLVNAAVVGGIADRLVREAIVVRI